MFINFTNHKSVNWEKSQIEASQAYGDIVDVSFPNVDSQFTEEEVQELAARMVDEIKAYNPSCVLCQGEFTLAYCVITMLKESGIPVVAACSERVVAEYKDGDVYKKTSQFKFVKYRRF